MSISWCSFDILLSFICVPQSECIVMLMRHDNIYLWTHNVNLLFFLCFFSLYFQISLLLAVHGFICFPLLLSPFHIFLSFTSASSVPSSVLLFLWVSFILSPSTLLFHLLHFWVWAQETSGLPPAVGCGRHGEDAWARLEVCVHIPAGVLQGSGDKGPG